MTRFRNAFLTGASSGIGRALALELARRGTRVVGAARRGGRLAELVADAEGTAGRVEACDLDVRDPEAVFEAVRRWDRELGGLDLVVANAGVGSAGHARDMDWQDVARLADVNFRGALATLVAAKEVMLPRGYGTLAGVSSLAGLRALPSSGAYSASKAGLQAFLETLELDLRPSGLRVVDIQPGFVRSEMTDRNDFEMPLLMEVELCARICADGLEAGRSVVHFPWQLSWPLRLGRALPRPWWRLLAGRLRR